MRRFFGLLIPATLLLLYVGSAHAIREALPGTQELLEEDSWFSGHAETSLWTPWLIPSIPKNGAAGIIVAHKGGPSVMTGISVSMTIKEDTHIFFEYLTGVLEDKIADSADPSGDNKIVFRKAFRYRPQIVQKVFGSHYILTRVDAGSFKGSARLLTSAKNFQRESVPVDSSFFSADVLAFDDDGSDLFIGLGLRFTEHNLPAILFAEDPDRPPQLRDTRIRTIQGVISYREGSLLSSNKYAESFDEFSFFVNEILLGFGGSETYNDLVGYKSGIATSIDVDAGYRRDWRPWKGAVLSTAFGARSNFIQTLSWDSNVESRTWMVGPYVRTALAF